MSDGPVIPATFGARHAQPIEAFLDQTSRVDLDEMMRRLDGGTDFSRATQAERDQVTAIAKTLLEPGNRPLLEWLCDITLRRPVFLPGFGADAVAYCAHREGQN